MATPTSGAISLANVQSEFGGTNPISLSEYYSGGSYVTGGTTGGNGSDGVSAATVIPTSGLIKLANFYSASATPLTVTIGGKTYPYTASRVFEIQGAPTVGSMMSFTVPTAMTIKVELWGGGGGMQSTGTGVMDNPAGGGYVYGNYQFQPNVTYGLIIAGGGGGPKSLAAGGAGAWNGGKGGTTYSLGTLQYTAGGGGGATGLFVGTTPSLASAIGIAGGGGGAGGKGGDAGGGGGTASGGVGSNAATPTSGTAAQGGQTSAGGTGGTGPGGLNGSSGGQGTGGAGNDGNSVRYPGGGGGGGLYGGGGGASISDIEGAGGAGGSSYVGGFISATTGGTAGTYGHYNPGVLARPYGGMAGQASGLFLVTSGSDYSVGSGPFIALDTLWPGTTGTGMSADSVTTTSVITSGSTSCTFTVNFYTAASAASGATIINLGYFRRWWSDPGATFTVDGISGTYTLTSSPSSADTWLFTPGLSAAVPAGSTVRLSAVAGTHTGSATNGLASTAWMRIGGTDGVIVVLNAAPTNTLSFGAVYPITDIPIGSTIQRYVTFLSAGESPTMRNILNHDGFPGAARFTFISKP